MFDVTQLNAVSVYFHHVVVAPHVVVVVALCRGRSSVECVACRPEEVGDVLLKYVEALICEGDECLDDACYA